MPRRPRLFVPGATYHVFCRVARGELAFDDRLGAGCFVSALREVTALDGWRVLAWCLIANHYHVVARTASNPLWRSRFGSTHESRKSSTAGAALSCGSGRAAPAPAWPPPGRTSGRRSPTCTSTP
jgi:hypothetical protein